MDHNGARSNPRLEVEFGRLGEVHSRLLRKAALPPRQPRSAPAKRSRVVEAVTLTLARADRPSAHEIHAAAQELAGEGLLWTSVKAILAAGASGDAPLFRRVRHGVYQSARVRFSP